MQEPLERGPRRGPVQVTQSHRNLLQVQELQMHLSLLVQNQTNHQWEQVPGRQNL